MSNISFRHVGAAAATLGLMTAASLGHAQQWSWPTSCPGYSRCPEINFPSVMSADPDARRVAAEVEREEDAALARSAAGPLSAAQQQVVLGKILMFDRNLSAGRNQACASCHTPAAGFTGGISTINLTSASMPGSDTMRTSNRKPPSLAYAAFSPVLHYRASTDDFVGGNFWDHRATGELTGEPAADQALQPFLNPVEMALPDQACSVRRVATGAYAGFFRNVVGKDALAIRWPAGTDRTCSMTNNGGADQTPISLTAADRLRAESSYYAIAMAIAAFERSAEVSPFSSKFDAYLAGRAALTPTETRGLNLFRGKAQCDDCHLSTGARPMFTDFTSVNIGIPRNRANPFFSENVADQAGYVANALGAKYVDDGLGGFLAGSANTNPQWRLLAKGFIGTFKVATLRNVAAKPSGSFTRAYMHNGYFTDLKAIVHFYNTRDVLPRCGEGSQGGGAGVAGVTCWPAPAQGQNLDHTETGNLGLTPSQEDAVVAFLGTLTDGYKPAP